MAFHQTRDWPFFPRKRVGIATSQHQWDLHPQFQNQILKTHCPNAHQWFSFCAMDEMFQGHLAMPNHPTYRTGYCKTGALEAGEGCFGTSLPSILQPPWKCLCCENKPAPVSKFATFSEMALKSATPSGEEMPFRISLAVSSGVTAAIRLTEESPSQRFVYIMISPPDFL